MSDVLARARAAMQSGEAAKRGAHFALGKALSVLPASTRRSLFVGSEHYCPLCESTLRRFVPLYRTFYAFCPVCWSLQRHRLVWLFVHRLTDLSSRPETHMLHVAPEPSLSTRFQDIAGLRYLSADLHNPRAMVRMDVCDIRFPDASFDVIYCSHVLEHVLNDYQAMRELHRVLAPDGWALLLVPITAEQTIEDASVTDPAERERLFGQHDHVRRYGMDFANRLRAAGFNARIFRAEDVATEQEIAHMGLARDEPLFYCPKA